jgi:hypothetical protein
MAYDLTRIYAPFSGREFVYYCLMDQIRDAEELC